MVIENFEIECDLFPEMSTAFPLSPVFQLSLQENIQLITSEVITSSFVTHQGASDERGVDYCVNIKSKSLFVLRSIKR
jgi:hypothetical protein